MPDTNNEQESLSTEEVVSLLTDDTPSNQPVRKGYEDYVREAEAEATADESNDKVEKEDKVEESGFEMPSKFEGKSAEEIAASYMELQSEYGRRNNEVGSLRKLTDQLLELKTDTPKEETKTPVDVDTLLSNPGDTINEAVESNPRLKAIEDKLVKADQDEALGRLETKHPNWVKTLQSEEFQAWIMESPIRQRLFVEADTNYDYDTGSELFDMYALSKGNAVSEAKQERDTNARKSAKQAVTESGGNAEGKPKKKFRRTELIQLKLTNPAKYAAMQEEIMQAYAEKRVI